MITDKQGGHCHYRHYYTGTILRPGLQSATGHSAVIIATSWGGQWQLELETKFAEDYAKFNNHGDEAPLRLTFV